MTTANSIQNICKNKIKIKIAAQPALLPDYKKKVDDSIPDKMLCLKLTSCLKEAGNFLTLVMSVAGLLSWFAVKMLIMITLKRNICLSKSEGLFFNFSVTVSDIM